MSVQPERCESEISRGQCRPDRPLDVRARVIGVGLGVSSHEGLYGPQPVRVVDVLVLTRIEGLLILATVQNPLMWWELLVGFINRNLEREES